ncbi:peptidase M38 [Gluconacetobacter liquefaciens]|uniref:Amidohydrolase family protein n=1 Tax=Gluconacetobacter liquefaciens TaxID=89584 RepID=A0A370FYV4_GLULI|nr:amidohydrolase family protein [Gluconacetobacter liquefaciens]MBB2188107.1 amidohydrolase family protein [Gluconacetobacter liquefaciens]RDI36110.1 imidazolonepropionase-like amidohydrolase [Gluconacetobacter liquefaciens]GBQ96266.1 amidohydrolase [Gluconacetobacter liquefaciens NRIC 0522]GEB38520.1 peptidase M38 [Gluconacetobacter liquefaciens]
MVTVFDHCNLLDLELGDMRPAYIVVEKGTVREVSDTRPSFREARRIDVGGRTVMPGLIDAHAHVTLSEVNLGRLGAVPPTLMAARASSSMRAMLDRGFTTVRDMGGADYGLVQAVREGHFAGPRLFISGRPLSQTGGHADHRLRTEGDGCGCSGALAFQSRIVDGRDAVRRGVREELRLGAHQIKIMASGGVASEHDPIDGTQFSIEEIETAVAEAASWGTYVGAHAYGADAIRRIVQAGVRTVEHGNLLDAQGARLMAERGAYLVPTLVAYDMLAKSGAEHGLSPASGEKLQVVLAAGLDSLRLARNAGVKIGFGSDLLGPLQGAQSREFLIRAEAEPPIDILRSATMVNAEIVQQSGKLGVIAPGSHADLLVVDGNPLKDLSVLTDTGASLELIMANGRIHKNRIG